MFLAHDAMLDRDVAFALIKTEGLDATGRERVVREAQAMGRLGAHQNIVSIFDIGEHEGAPYDVTELMGGGDVEGLLEKHMGRQARLMSQALRKLTSIIARSNTIVIFINQLRMKIGVMFGNPETTTGGQALKFYASVRVDVRRAAQIKKGEMVVGNRVKAKVVKNKVAPPFRVAEFDIMYNEGISQAGDLLDTAVLCGIIKKAGNSYSFGEIKLGVGRENAKSALKADPKLIKEIEKVTLQASKDLALAPVAVPDETEE